MLFKSRQRYAGFASAYRCRKLEEQRIAQNSQRLRSELLRERATFPRHFPGNFPGAGFPGPGGGPFGGGMPGFPPGIIGGDFDRSPGLLPPFHNPRPLQGGPSGLGGFHPPGAVPPGARYDPISPLVDPVFHGGGPMGRGGRGRGTGRGRGGMLGGRFDPDGPDLPDIL